jgi:DNA polymerase III subunit gamma/tau
MLYQKYRPIEFSQIKGNSDLIQTLEGMLSDLQTCPHTFLFTGESGTGKTTLARIIANRLGCKGQDYTEMNMADLRGIDTVRDIISTCQFMPIEGNVRVWVLDEVHQVTGAAANSLLKILEDTPSHVYFILCTTEPQKLLETIKGRCSIFQTKPLSDAQMFGVLRRIVTAEKQQLEKEVYDQIIQDSLGHARNAIQILEQVLNVPEDRRLEIARQTTQEQTKAIELCRALLSGATWKKVAEILSGLRDQEPESIRRVVLGYAQSILLKEDNKLCGLILEEFLPTTYNSGFPQIVLSTYCVVKNK